ncbi:MAG: ABC transporter permease [Bacteroidetes bacterium]|nr:ABC transporter permease [Bacteroidota bacterium]
MNLPLFIARRYLFAKKSHNVINLISWITALGMMAGTLAFIVILSVYNGFDHLVQSLYNTFDADLVIKPATGKYIDGCDPLWDDIKGDPLVAAWCEIVEETVVIEYRNRSVTAMMKGVDSIFTTHTPLIDRTTDGAFSTHLGEIPQIVMGQGLARNLGVNIHFIDPIYLYFPSLSATFNPLNPQASLHTQKLFPSGIFAVEQNYDSQYFFIPLATARQLMEYTTEVSYIEIRLQPGASTDNIQAKYRRLLEPHGYLLQNRYQQNESLYKMMRTEKIVIYFLLLFVLLIISCNILGSMALLIIEKREDMVSLQSLGASPVAIKRIFLLEGWMITVLGSFFGLIFGLLLCFLQQRFGLISLPGNFMITAYPVLVMWNDIALVLASVLLIGYLAARASVRFFILQ